MNSLPLSESTPEDRNGMAAAMSFRAAEHPFAGLVAHAAVLGPAGGDIGHRERVRHDSPIGVAAVVADQVDLDEPRHCVVPAAPRCGSGSATLAATPAWSAAALELMPAALGGQAPVDRGRRHRHQQRRGVVVGDSAHRTAAAPPPVRTASAPAVSRPASPAPPSRKSAPQRHSCRTSADAARAGVTDLRPQRAAQRLARMITMPARRGAQLVEDPPLARLAGPPVAGRDRLRHSLALTQRQIPSSGPTAPHQDRRG